MANFDKRHVAHMPLAYAVCAFESDRGTSFMVGPEKAGAIRRFSLDGDQLECVSDGPGGVMTLVQVPGRSDQLLATCEFFSPNFGADTAHIRVYARTPSGAWTSSKLCDLPYVHRFGVLRAADGRAWLLACTLKGACRRIKEDWSRPGAVWAAPLAGDLSDPDVAARLELRQIASEQVQNHGFWCAPDGSFALVSTAAGVFRYRPPASAGQPWEITCLIVQPTSDVCMVDLDGDGKDELVTFSAFHGEHLAVWHVTEYEDMYECVWRDERARPFLHAICVAELEGNPCALVGHRRGEQALLCLTHAQGAYRIEEIDTGAGPANCLAIGDGRGGACIVAANRETDEIALYTPR